MIFNNKSDKMDKDHDLSLLMVSNRVFKKAAPCCTQKIQENEACQKRLIKKYQDFQEVLVIKIDNGILKNLTFLKMNSKRIKTLLMRRKN